MTLAAGNRSTAGKVTTLSRDRDEASPRLPLLLLLACPRRPYSAWTVQAQSRADSASILKVSILSALISGSLRTAAAAPRGKLVYSVDEIAKLLGVSTFAVRTVVSNGTLARVSGLGRAVRIPSHAAYELVGEAVSEPNGSGQPVQQGQTAVTSGGVPAPQQLRHEWRRGGMAENDRRTAVVVGVLWITATIAGLLSAVLLQPTLDAQDYLSRAAGDQARVATALLLDLVMAIAIVAIAVVFYPVLRRSNQRLALGFFAARTIEGVVYLIGISLSLLILVTISQEFVKADAVAAADLESLSSMFMGGLDWVNYTVLVVVFSSSALILNAALYQSRLVPRWLSVWGLVGAAAYLLSGIAVMYGLEAFSTPQTLMMAPLAVQEMVFALWLIVKGFDSGATKTETA